MKKCALLMALTMALPLAAAAHKPWLIPTEATVNGAEVWVGFDAAISNDLFTAGDFPMQLSSIVATAPDGRRLALQNALSAKHRSTFDLELTQQGTYRIASVNDGLSARWETPASLAAAEKAKAEGTPPHAGEGMRVRPAGFLRNATPQDIASKIPKDAQQVQISETVSRIETFVTNGKPTPVRPTGKGLELLSLAAPTDLVSGEATHFKLTVDGQPAAGLEVQVIRGGTRYRDGQDEIKASSGEDGQLSLTFPQPGLYWLSVTTEDDKVHLRPATRRRLSYVVTLEVLPQ